MKKRKHGKAAGTLHRWIYLCSLPNFGTTRMLATGRRKRDISATEQDAALIHAHADPAVESFCPPFVPPAARMRRFPFMLPRFLRNPLLCIPSDAYEKPIVLVPGPPLRVYVCDPELVKTVLLERREIFPKTAVLRRLLGPLLGRGILLSEGDEWRWQRQIVAPLFRQSEILDYVAVMARAAETQIEKWRTAGLDKVHMIDRDMSQTTYEIISNTILSGGGDAVGEAMRQDAGDYIAGMPWLLVYAVLSIPDWVPRPQKRRMRRRELRLRGAVRDLVHRRRLENDSGEDLLARLLAARRLDNGTAMADEEMVDMLLTFLTAGHDTTAKALTWALYLLSRSREWEERVLREIADVVPSGTIEPHHIDKLKTVSQVIKETLRLYPPAPETTRIASVDTELGGHSDKGWHDH